MFRRVVSVCIVIASCSLAAADDIAAPSTAAPHSIAVESLAAPAPALIGSKAIETHTTGNQTDTREEKIALLRRKQHELELLQREVRRLREETGAQQAMVVRVQVVDVSLTKLQELGCDPKDLQFGYADAEAERSLGRIAEKLGASDAVVSAMKRHQNSVSALIDVLTSHQVADVLAAPMLMMTEGRSASLNVGGEVPVPEMANSKAAVGHQKVATQLDILPVGLGNNRVRLEVNARWSDADWEHPVRIGGSQYPTISTRQCNTVVETSFGRPVVLKGLVESRKETIKDGDGRSRNVTNRSEFLFVITPDLADAPIATR